jgi:uncharacterized cupredoxin-like copper-binding protein
MGRQTPRRRLVGMERRMDRLAGARPRRPGVGGLALLAVLLAACGGSSAAAHGRTVTIHASDFAFTQGVPQTLPAGAVHVVLKNDSKSMLHELWLYPAQQPRLPDLLAQKRSGQDADEADYLQGIAGKVEDLPAGKRGAFDAQLSPGTYEIACFETATINGQKMVHYDMGMHATFTVQ